MEKKVRAMFLNVLESIVRTTVSNFLSLLLGIQMNKALKFSGAQPIIAKDSEKNFLRFSRK